MTSLKCWSMVMTLSISLWCAADPLTSEQYTTPLHATATRWSAMFNALLTVCASAINAERSIMRQKMMLMASGDSAEDGRWHVWPAVSRWLVFVQNAPRPEQIFYIPGDVGEDTEKRGNSPSRSLVWLDLRFTPSLFVLPTRTLGIACFCHSGRHLLGLFEEILVLHDGFGKGYWVASGESA